MSTPPQSLKRLVYVSSAVEPFSDEALKKLLAVSRRKNERRGITGLLLYSDGTFLQVLEGEPQVVETLFAKIVRDPRHRGALRLLDQPIAARTFADWSMAFKSVDPEQARQTPGFNAALESQSAGYALPQIDAKILKLVETFRRVNR